MSAYFVPLFLYLWEKTVFAYGHSTHHGEAGHMVKVVLLFKIQSCCAMCTHHDDRHSVTFKTLGEVGTC